MEPSLRKALDNSYVAPVSIGVLLLWSVEYTLHALWFPLWRATDFIITAVAILDIPYLSRTLTTCDWLGLIPTLADLVYGLVSLAAAWALSRWVYGSGPLRSLCIAGGRLTRRNHL